MLAPGAAERSLLRTAQGLVLTWGVKLALWVGQWERGPPAKEERLAWSGQWGECSPRRRAWLWDQERRPLFSVCRYPIQTPREACYGDMDGFPGVRNYGVVDPNDLYDVYCYAEDLNGKARHRVPRVKM